MRSDKRQKYLRDKMFSDSEVKKKEPGFYLISNIGMYKERMGLSEEWLLNDPLAVLWTTVKHCG